jgi:hypothetical protein
MTEGQLIQVLVVLVAKFVLADELAVLGAASVSSVERGAL